jgi:phosphate transport system substrate-binding protein
MNKMRTTLISILAAGGVITGAHAQTARDNITVAAGYAPYPMAVAVGERVTQAGKFKKPPNIQSTSPESAYKQFCAGNSLDTLDATVVLRPMTTAEEEACTANGVEDIVKFKTGVTAVVIAFTGNTNDFKHLTRKELFLAMAKDVPDPQGGGKLIANPYKTWKEINPAFPETKIQIWNSSPVFAYYPVVMNQIMMFGCKQIPALQSLASTDAKAFETACTTFRKDGHYSEYDSLDTIRPKLGDSMGLFTDAFATKFSLTKLPLDGNEPLPASISRNVYPVVSPLMIHVKKSHLDAIPGLKDYIQEALSESAISSSGYLIDQGLVPLALTERRQMQTMARDLIK